MRLGVTGIKIWLSFAPALDMKIQTFLHKFSKTITSKYSGPAGAIMLPVKIINKSNFTRNSIRSYYKRSFLLNSKRALSLLFVGYKRSILSKYSYIY